MYEQKLQTSSVALQFTVLVPFRVCPTFGYFAPNCIKNFFDLPDNSGQSGLIIIFLMGDSSQSGLTLQLFLTEFSGTGLEPHRNRKMF